MGCRTEAIDINDHEYCVTQWSAHKALINKFRMMKILGPLLKLIKVDVTDDQKLGGALGEVLSDIFHHSDPEELASLMKDFVTGAARDGKKMTEANITEYFSGDSLVDYYQVFIFVVKVNFGNLLQGQSVKSLLSKVI